MVLNGLRDWIEALEAEGELVRVQTEVDPYLELSQIVDRVSKEDGAANKALLFENVKGSSMPVFINGFGSRRRVGISLEASDIEEHAARLEALLHQAPPETLIEKIKALPKLKELANFFPRKVSSAPCQEIVLTGDEVDIGRLPVLTTWPQDADPFITYPLCVTQDPETGRRNLGTYRLQVRGPRETFFHSHLHKDARRHLEKAAVADKKIPVAVAIGADPATCFASVVPAPPDVDELLIAGFLRRDSVPLVACKSVPLEVPATAEIVLEGWINPANTATEGPFGDHTGFYSLADEYPIFEIDTITHRKNPIYHSILVGAPPQEDHWITQGIERLMLPVLRMQFPEIVDYRLPFEGVAHNLMLVQIKKTYPGQARKVMHGLWGLGQAMFTKVIVVVDESVNIHDDAEVVWKVLNHIDPQRDMEFALGPVETLDHASRAACYGSHVGVDATKKTSEEGFTREWPDEILMSTEVKDFVEKRWQEYGLP